jgi:ribose/xylose/arabinose/galactoside ABC-type transport system permease subunit
MSGSRRLTRVLAVEGVAVGFAFVAMFAFFSLTSPFFLTGQNMRNLLVESVFVTLVAAGMTYVLVVGGIDLSVGSVLGLSSAMTLLTLMNGFPLWAGILAGIATGAVAGLINGAVIAGLGVNDFIVTLAMLSIGAGLLQVVTSKTQLTGVKDGTFTGLANGSIAGIPTPVIIAAVVLALLEFVLVKTPFGRSVYAAGISERAAHLAGVSVRSLRFKVYVLSGAIAGLSGVLLASRLNSVQPGLGAGYELTAIAAAVVGGISLSGGRGSVWRSVVGALFLSTLSQGLQLLGVDPLWFAIVTGASIIAAVAFDRGIQRLAASLLRADTPAGRAPTPRTPAGSTPADRVPAERSPLDQPSLATQE